MNNNKISNTQKTSNMILKEDDINRSNGTTEDDGIIRSNEATKDDVIIGRCIGEATPASVGFISKKMPTVGEFVTLEYEGKRILGMIENLMRESTSIGEDIYDPAVIDKIKQIEGDDYYITGNIKILGHFSDINNLKVP